MSGWFDFVLLVLASFRLTHLVVFDQIAEPLRQWAEPRPFLSGLISCYWCCGIWVSLGLFACGRLLPGAAAVLIPVLAVAGGQALLERAIQGRPAE